MAHSPEFRARVEKLTKRIADEGFLVKAGWISFSQLSVDQPRATTTNMNDLRIAFYCGAMHLFHSILAMMDEGESETDNDIRRMDRLHAELEEFSKEVEGMLANAMRTKGSA